MDIGDTIYDGSGNNLFSGRYSYLLVIHVDVAVGVDGSFEVFLDCVLGHFFACRSKYFCPLDMIWRMCERKSSRMPVGNPAV